MDKFKSQVRRIFQKRNRPKPATTQNRATNNAGSTSKPTTIPTIGPGPMQGIPPGGAGRMLPPGSTGPTTLGTIRKPDPISDDDDDDDIESVGNYNGQSGPIRRPQINTIQSDDTTRSGNPYGGGSTNPSTPMNPATSPFRNPSAGFLPDARSTTTMNTTANRVGPSPSPRPPSQATATLFDQIRDPTSRPPLKPVSTPVPTIRNPTPINSTTNDVVTPPSSTGNPSGPLPPTTTAIPLPGPSTTMNNQIIPFPNPSNHDETSSRIELDYPIENILIDANIPSAVATKINDAVEKDRRGNPIHIHRYTFEPRSQEINYTDPSMNSRQTDGGFRRIREINPQSTQDSQWNSFVETIPPIQHPGQFVIHTENLQTLQSILGENLFVSNPPLLPFVPPAAPSYFPISNGFEEPVYYYTARALPNDPMRSY